MCRENCACPEPCAECLCEKQAAEEEALEVTITCHECGAEIEEGDDSQEIGGHTYCDNCVVRCDECGDYIPESDSETVRLSASGRRVTVCSTCESDSHYCDCCGSTFIGDSHRADNDDTLCVRCSDQSYWYCDECDAYHHNDDSCPNSSEEERQQDETPILGTANERFTLRTVGVEIETGRGGSDLDFREGFSYKFRHWGYKEDGSLRNGGMELVSPPMGGAVVEQQLAGVYDLLRFHGVDMADQHAGCHIHVDYRDVRSALVAADSRGTDRYSDAFVKWGDEMVAAVRVMVSAHRAENSYCSSAFGTRNYGEAEPAVQSKVRHSGYATIAVRRHTLEFRVWEVTDDAELTAARAEFSQKSVEFLSKVMRTRTPKSMETLMNALERSLESLKTKGSFAGIRRLFKLSDDCIETLSPVVRSRVGLPSAA